MMILIESFYNRLELSLAQNMIWSLTQWGRVMHICVCKLIIIGSDSGLLSGQRQTIIWTNPGMLIGPLVTNFSEILIVILTFSVKKIHLKMSSGKRRPFRLGINLLISLHNKIQQKVHWCQWDLQLRTSICQQNTCICFTKCHIHTWWNGPRYIHDKLNSMGCLRKHCYI